MDKLTVAEIYKKIKQDFTDDYNGFFMDDYVGQNKAERKATLYAVKNTIQKWRAQ